MGCNGVDTRLYPLIRRGACILNAVGDVVFALVLLPVLERGTHLGTGDGDYKFCLVFLMMGPQGVGAYLAIACFGLYGGRRAFLCDVQKPDGEKRYKPSP